ncbi:hypothetical protein N7532_007338 [Penicillium argentinense]|uniref:F-box domain-containing protein n=1 Tax=Penicillium argentinense TaxID=1131581 RepID=A0A9W9F7R2_9EURO|nr:uncharacterized protein N7532_007338 [Penicillium argentinense]KAJ5095047.1 hypothetical protein N7532_007338 [Penicillium argentinense]
MGSHIDPTRQGRGILWTLPIEVVIQILSYTDDFYGLHSLISVSPYAASVLTTYPALILDQITRSHPLFRLDLSVSGSGLFPHIDWIFWTIALAISGPSFDYESLSQHVNISTDSTPISLKDLLSGENAPSIALALIDMAASIQRLACACLSRMVENLQPAVSNSSILSECVDRDFPPPNSIPFSWVEEYRVYRALWHLQRYSLLRELARKWNWSEENLAQLDRYAKFSEGVKGGFMEEILSVSEALQDLGIVPDPKPPPTPRHHPNSALDSLMRLDPVAIDLGETIPLFNFREMNLDSPGICQKRLQQSQSQSMVAWRVWTPPPVPANNDINYAWEREARHALSMSAPSISSWMEMSFDFAYGTPSRFLLPGYGGEIQSFRRLGVFLWDHWRMYVSGLVTPWLYLRTETPNGSPIGPSRHGRNESLDAMRLKWWSLVGRYPARESDVQAVVEGSHSEFGSVA